MGKSDRGQIKSSRRLRGLVAGFAVVAALVVTAAVVSAEGTPANPSTTGPGTSWTKVSPASVGLSAAKLDQMAATAKKGKSNCLVVVRYGKLAGEWYFNGTTPNTAQDIYSATKSVTSTLVGIAQGDGDLNIAESASKWIPSWQGTPAQAVTIHNLLSMDSGRKWDFRTDYLEFLRAPDRTAFAVGLPQQEPPGQVWAYNNSAVQTLEPVLAAATGDNVVDFAHKRLFAPLGMTHTRMTTDKAGNAQMFEGVESTCRDMARFGVMMLDHGRWDGKQIVPSQWVTEATGRSSTSLNAGYGYLWWLNHYGVLSSPEAATSLQRAKDPTTKQGRIAPGAPADMYWALGLGNQLVQVDPGTQTVVVRLGSPEPVPKPPTFGPKQASEIIGAVTPPEGHHATR
jgi:CubicO group peptidase (beta-lactamase class C family)